MLAEELRERGLKTHTEAFTFNESLYANIALHFGVGAVGNMVGQFVPGVSTFVSSVVAGSYWSDSVRTAYVLRKMLP